MNAPSPASGPPQPKPEARPAADAVAGGVLHGRIAEQVIRRLGSPAGPYRVHVRPLWGDRYRVNVIVGQDITSALIVESYFLVADGDGKILRSSPEITRRSPAEMPRPRPD